MTSGPTASDALSASLFGSEPTLLEQVVVQAANDLKVTGFGQRTRAALRRNRSAESNSVLPYSMFKDVVGPDLVRHLNALTLLLNSEQPLQTSSPGRADEELFVALRDQLAVVRHLVSELWSDPLNDHAKVFIDYDNVPIPFCPMYPDARDLIRSNPAALPQPLAKIVQRIRNQVQETPIMRESRDCLSDLTSTDLQNLEDTRKNFTSQAVYQRGETLLEWQVRVHQLVAAAQTDVPVAVLLSNTLIHSVISSVVSLAVWDHELASSEVLSTMPWGRHAVGGEPPDGDATDEDPDDTGPYGPDIPDGFGLRLVPNSELMLLPMETSVRLHDQGRFCGVAIAKGASLSWRRGEEIEVGLTMVRLSAYEVDVDARGLP